MSTANEDPGLDHCILDDGGRIVRTDKVPWTRLNAPGFEAITYKILNYDLDRAYMVLLNTFDPGSRFPPGESLSISRPPIFPRKAVTTICPSRSD